MTTDLPAGPPALDRRRRRARRTRESLASAAFELVLDEGLRAVTVERIAERADVARRTFSRHFTSKESAVLDVLRADGERINELLRARPPQEPPLAAYRAAALAWLSDEAEPAWHRRPRVVELLRLTRREPALLAALRRIRSEAQDEAVRVVAARLGVDPARDPRPAVLVNAAAGALAAAQELWVAGGARADLPTLVERAFAALTGEGGQPRPLPRQREATPRDGRAP
ncbi:TetR/AcrR family transcriptional regulator [Streptomyces hoynatensis]|uniref:TetR/AcrR family transcriptional regulator n=1 Tax=Streptomyces hoynatensis TaxID=1141874 RepID=A0A3A9YXY3_9ACTN|nr:TetR/AcrR family transcriptional regulator [Streptomyces hoynatensis]RKN40730.1 TetR/AcrR family transcriptional regulator [Streptomyces hoynatensis]